MKLWTKETGIEQVSQLLLEPTLQFRETLHANVCLTAPKSAWTTKQKRVI